MRARVTMRWAPLGESVAAVVFVRDTGDERRNKLAAISAASGVLLREPPPRAVGDNGCMPPTYQVDWLPDDVPLAQRPLVTVGSR